ncbi:MAG: DNA polymerase Y family protein [Comamonadaceae bacterium]|nr:DNA polymerase Y family protein [Burkholderiales bacterium]MEB2347141.1 DNA polymerase Y family protein [Comamonadaceae bacterium]
MQWIALQWPPETPPTEPAATTVDDALAWWALRFTPHVARLDEALLLEVSGSLRLWGGLPALAARIKAENPAPPLVWQTQAAIGIVALARLRLRASGENPPPPALLPEALPLSTLSAAQPHLPLLSGLGCRTWGQAHQLPRAGLARRCGPGLRAALDVAFGLAPETYPWIVAPERFDQALELPTHVETAPALLWSAARLLTALQHWLRARQLGVRALQLSWTLDQKRLNGQPLPSGQSLTIRTAEPTQTMEHLRRLLAERLAQVRLLAPAAALRLRATETAPWQADSRSLLPEERRAGDALHVFIERVSARLGHDRVLTPQPVADHRPEQRQRWQPAQQVLGVRGHTPPPGWVDALAPTWLLPAPEPLALRRGRPCCRGPLTLLAGPRRIEAGWWPQGDGGAAAARDYYVARNPAAELLWIFRERPTHACEPAHEARWFLHGVYG